MYRSAQYAALTISAVSSFVSLLIQCSIRSSIPKASTGRVWASYPMMYLEEDLTVEAHANIPNASNFTVAIKIDGFALTSNLDLSFLNEGRTPVKPRSFAILCDAAPNRQQQKSRIYEFGKRSENDFLVRFERRQSKPIADRAHLPSHTFNFYDEDVNINYVALKVNVRRECS